MKVSLHFILLSISFLIATSSSYAETRYISDQLIVTVRSGKGNQYKILETLPTSTPVQILEDDKVYVKVVTPKGVEGYIRSQYVNKSTPKIIQIKQLNNEIMTLQQQLTIQQNDNKASRSEAIINKTKITELSSQLKQTQQRLDKVNSEYETLSNKSKNVLNLSTENEQLAEQSNLLNSELLVLREENQNFHRSNMIQWFLAGGGVFFGGWMIGKISRRKQRRF